jgi:hypothetical protein
MPAHEAAPLAEAFRRAVLRLFARRGFFEDEETVDDPTAGTETCDPSGHYRALITTFRSLSGT